MQNVYLEDYDVDLNFPDGMSEDRIKDIIKRDYPEPDEKLVARFDNPETPSHALSREDFSRYKRVKPPTALSDLPGIVVDAASMTAGLIAKGLPEAVKTYGNIFDPGTAARTFMEGAARGAYDTETLGKMANNYLRSKVEAFSGTSENEEDDQYKRFLALKELQNVRAAIERGDRSAWNEYAEFAGAEGMKIDESRINTAAAELTGEIIDPATLIPGTKIGAMAAKGATRALSTPVRGLGKGLSRAADATRKGQDWATSKIRGFEEAIDEGTGGLGKVVIPGGIGAAAASGVIGGGAATFGAGAIAAPTIMDLAGGLLTGFGEAMAHTPTRLGGLGRLASNMPDTVAGKLAGRIKWMDRPAEYAGRAAAGAGVGAGVGAGIGLVSGGLEGMAQGIGSGGVLGAAGGGFARTVEGLTGSNLRKAQDSDFDRWVSKKDPDDRKRLSAIKDRKDRMIRMDAEEILLGAGAEVRHVGPDHEVNGRKLGKAQGYHDIEGGKNIVYLNTNADAGTMSHEVYHALARLDGFDMMNSSIKQLHQRLHSPEEINKFIQTYEKSLKNRIPLSEGQIEKMGTSTEAKVDYILEELGAEYFRNTIEGKNSDYIFSGNSFAESLKGIFARFTKGKLDRVYDTFKSPILGDIKKTRQMDRMMADLVKARRRSARDVEMSIDEPVRVYSDADLSDDQAFAEMEGMGIAKIGRGGKRVIIGKTEQARVAKDRTAKIAGILDKVPDQTGGMVKQPDGSYRGTRFSAGQLKALLESPEINNTIKKAIQEIQKIAEGDQYANWTYAAALVKTKRKGLNRYANLPVSNRDAMLYDLVVSPTAGTITGRMLDMSMTESRARKLYSQSGEMQKLFGSEAQLFKDLHDYINALTSGEKRTAEVLGSQRKSDFLSKILAVRNVKGNPEIPDPASMSRAERGRAEGASNHPWRSFRLDRIVSMKQKQGRPIMSFSEAAYQRGQSHFMPDVDEYGYRMSHRAPDAESGASLDKIGGEMYPDDIYGPRGADYYGEGDYESRKTIELFRRVKGKPDAMVTVYRAVPKGITDTINPGDWVTTSQKYADLHAGYFENTGADILQQKVRAGDLYSEGNSIFELGWSPGEQEGQVRFSPGSIQQIRENDIARFSPSPDNPNASLSDFVGKKVQVLTSDLSTGKDKKVDGITVSFRGGPAYLEMFDGWAFTNEGSAKAFRTRWERDGRPLIGITSMLPNNHLNSKLARRYYAAKWRELVEQGKIAESTVNKHLRAAMKRVAQGKNALTKEQRKMVSNIKTHQDFAKAFELIPWKAAPTVYQKLAGKTLPITAKRQEALGVDLDSIAEATREPAYADVGPGHLLAIAEYNGADPTYKPDLNENYPWMVELKEKAFLDEYHEVTGMTSREDVKTSSGKPNTAVLMGAGVTLDKLASGDVRFSPDRTPTKTDQTYLSAVQSGDMGKAQALVDEAAKKAGYNVGPMYHGSRSTKKFNQFNPRKRSNNSLGKGYYFTDKKGHAEAYSTGNVINSHLKLSNPFIMDWRSDEGRTISEAKGESIGLSVRGGLWFNGDQYNNTKILKKAGHDGVVALQPASDSFPEHSETVVFNPDQIKLADPVTYDDQGNVIPLSERFNQSSDDIRFSPSKLDSDHAQAAKSGDIETAQRLVDEAAKRAGYSTRVKRGDGRDFKVFDVNKRGESTGAMSAKKAFFFTDSDSAAGEFARMSSRNEADKYLSAKQEQLQSQIDQFEPQALRVITDNLDDPSLGIDPALRDAYKKFINKGRLSMVQGFAKSQNYFDSPEVKSWGEAYEARVSKSSPLWLTERDKAMQEAGLQEEGVVRDFFINLQNVETIDFGGKPSRSGPTTYADALDEAQSRGLDGVIFKNTEDVGQVIDIYAVFEPSQIKSADPVTYDDQGNVIPLSKRFNQSSDDIRFSPSRTLSADEITAWAKSHTPSEIGEKLDSMKLTSTNNMLKLMGDFPEYLNPVIDYVVEKRQQLINGQISPRDVAKAYFITASSIGADAINVSKIKETTDRLGVDFNPDPMFLSRGAKGQLNMRPEEMAAWWLGTESGQRALNAIESGVIDRDAWEVGMAIRDAYGRQDFRTRQAGTPYANSKGESKLTTYRAGGTGDLTNQKEFNLTNIIPLTEAINKTKGNPRKLEKVLMQIKGVGEGKKGFIGHLIGMGSSPTIDAVELNIWLTGRGSTTRASESMKKRTALAKNAGGKQQQKLYDRITKRIKQLRKSVPEGSKIPVDVAPHILHHWIWDAGKGLETTHEGVYHAMIHFSPSRTLNNRGGAIYTTEQGHKAIQTSSRAGVRVYDSAGKRIGPVFASVERAERYLRK